MVIVPSLPIVVFPPHGLSPVSSHFGDIGFPVSSQSLFSVKVIGPTANSSHDFTLYCRERCFPPCKIRHINEAAVSTLQGGRRCRETMTHNLQSRVSPVEIAPLGICILRLISLDLPVLYA